MRVIARIQGVAATQVSLDEVSPPSSPPLMTIISGIQNRFSFAIAPAVGNVGTSAPLVFQVGKIVYDDQEFALHQLHVLPDGDMVLAANTDQAKLALELLIEYLNGQFGYRMEGPSARRYYVSGLVVEFERPIIEMISRLGSIREIITQLSTHGPFELLRLSFSQGTNGMPSAPFLNPLDALAKTDFLIERRVGVPFSDNRFYCTAPCETERHIEILQEIERTLLT
jgi:hypothetical protein